MQVQLNITGKNYQANLLDPKNIGIPLRFNEPGPNCFYAPIPEKSPVVAGDFVGDTSQGGVVNFMNVRINPHGNGTHTECVGHIATAPYSVNQSLQQFHFSCRLVSVFPQRMENGDRIIMPEQLEELLLPGEVQAVAIRTLPNDDLKLKTNYSGANPPFLHHESARLLVDYGVDHLLIDLPSVDKEQDEGKLSAHKAFWKYPRETRTAATITEMIYVEEKVRDGLYLLNLQMAAFEMDASPSKPVLYELND